MCVCGCDRLDHEDDKICCSCDCEKFIGDYHNPRDGFWFSKYDKENLYYFKDNNVWIVGPNKFQVKDIKDIRSDHWTPVSNPYFWSYE